MTVGTVIHIGDVHLCASDHRNPDRLEALAKIVARATELGVPGRLLATVIPGDLFHRASTPEDRNVLARVLQQLQTYAPVVVVPGNHDQAGELQMLHWLDWHGHPHGIVLIDHPHVVRVSTPVDGVELAVFGLPYPHRGGLVAREVAREQVIPTAHALLDAILAAGARELKAAVAEGAIPLVLAHVNVAGSIASTGQPQIGKEIELPPALLAHFPNTYVALNHIHKHQAIPGLLYGTEAVYAGSVGRMDFGEMEAKGYVEIEYTRTATLEISGGVPISAAPGPWAFEWRFVDLDASPQIYVVGRLEPDGFQMLEATKAYRCPDCLHDDIDDVEMGVSCPTCGGTGIDPAVLPRADVRVRFSYRKADLAKLKMRAPEALYAAARSLKVEGTPDRQTEVRAPEVLAAPTIPAKARAFFGLEGTPWTEEDEAALAELLGTLTGDREAWLDALDRTLAQGDPTSPAQEVRS